MIPFLRNFWPYEHVYDKIRLVPGLKAPEKVLYNKDVDE